VDRFLSSASSGDKDIVCRCLYLVKLGVANTTFSFEYQNWINGGDAAVEITKNLLYNWWLQISMFTAIVAAYILERLTELFSKSMFYGIYQEDSLHVIDGKKFVEEMVEWLR